MKETYYAGSYWLARHETAEACARRAERFFRLLERCEPTWNQWNDTVNSEEAQNSLVSLEAATFTRMFSREENRQGPDGFDLYLFAGDTVPTATTVNVSCGSATQAYPQACVLRPPSEGPIAERVLTTSVMTAVLRAMALAWEPEWGVVTSQQYDELVSPQRMPAGTSAGWVMYFSRLRGPVPPLPAPVRVEPVEDRGTLVILTLERFTASNPEHVALVAHIHELLKRAGLFHRLQPWPAG